MRSLIFLLGFMGCSEKSESDASCTVGDIDGYVAMADVGGTQWAGDNGAWTWTGDGLQIVLDESVGFSMTLRLNKTSSGDTIRDAVDNDDLPALVSISGADGTASVMQNRNGLVSYGTNQPGGGGELWLLAHDGNEVEACFLFDAVSDNGDVLSVADGRVRVAD